MTAVDLIRATGAAPDASPDAPRPNRRVAAKRATRAKLLAEARFLFTHVGYFATGIRDIAQRMGMSTGAVFANVEGKEQLWRDAMNGPAPSEPLAEEVALILALRPGWRWLLRFDGPEYLTQLSSPDWSPMRNGGRCHTARGDSPAEALRQVRLEADRHEPDAPGQGVH